MVLLIYYIFEKFYNDDVFIVLSYAYIVYILDKTILVTLVRYNKRYTYQSCWNVFLRGKSWERQQPIDLLQFQSLLICNDM